MTRKTTRTSSTAPGCYHDNAACEGDLWQCLSCRETFCQAHARITTRGPNKECEGCERERKDAEQLDADDPTDRLAARADPGNKLDIADK